MIRTFTLVVVCGATLTGCSLIEQAREPLSPAPQRGVAVQEIIPVSQDSIPAAGEADSAAAHPSEGAGRQGRVGEANPGTTRDVPRIRDAGSLRTLPMPMEQDVGGESKTVEVIWAPPPSPRDAVPPAEASTKHERWVAREGGLLHSRFDSLPDYPYRDPLKNNWTESVEFEAAEPTWRPLTELRDSLSLHRPWSTLHTYLIPGRPIAVRGIVWPTDARVHVREPSRIFLATDWVSLERFSSEELRCTTVGEGVFDREEDDRPSVRVVTELVPAPGGDARIINALAVRNASGCEASALALDRIASLRMDIWMAVNRATTLGTERLKGGGR